MKKTYIVRMDINADIWVWVKDAEDETIYIGHGVFDSYGWHDQHKISRQLLKEFMHWVSDIAKVILNLSDQANVIKLSQLNEVGIELAKKLKVEVGDSARVQYIKPVEDPSYCREDAIEVSMDMSLVPVKRLYWTPI